MDGRFQNHGQAMGVKCLPHTLLLPHLLSHHWGDGERRRETEGWTEGQRVGEGGEGGREEGEEEGRDERGEGRRRGTEGWRERCDPYNIAQGYL